MAQRTANHPCVVVMIDVQVAPAALCSAATADRTDTLTHFSDLLECEVVKLLVSMFLGGFGHPTIRLAGGVLAVGRTVDAAPTRLLGELEFGYELGAAVSAYSSSELRAAPLPAVTSFTQARLVSRPFDSAIAAHTVAGLRWRVSRS